MKAVTGKTQLVGVMGYPVSHTLSPPMQNAAIEAAGLDAVYIPLCVKPELVSQAVRGLPALGFRGANVTIPHKISAFEQMDHLTDEARIIGAVNTIRVEEDGSLTGHNTDCLGAIWAVENAGATVKKSKVLVLGAGGAGRAVAAGAAMSGASSITLLNRTVEKAEEVVQELRKNLPAGDKVSWKTGPLAGDFGGVNFSEFDVLFQMTSLGMKGKKELEFPVDRLSSHCHLLDAVYSPLETDLMKTGKNLGLPVTDGLAMLIGQGVESFKFWFGVETDPETMRTALMRTLNL